MGKKKKAKNKTNKKITKKIIKQSAKNLVSKTITKIKESVRPPERIEVNIITKSLGKVPEEHHFILHDGRKLKSLYELIDELETMSEDAFKEYVSEFRNDFANWTRDVFQAPDLAEELTRIKDKIETQKAVMKHMLRDVQKYIGHTLEQVKQEQHHANEENKPHKHHETPKHPHQKGGKCVIK